MNGLYEVLKELYEMVGKKLMDAKEKARAAGALSSADVEYLDCLTHSLKSIKTTMAMIDAEENGSYAEGNSGRWSDRGSFYPRGSHEGSYDDGMSDGESNARGRRNAKRDSMGRYASRMSGHGGFESELRELMEEAPNDQIRMELQRLMQQM